MELDKQKTWYVILYLITIILLIRYFPKAAYGVIAITLLVMMLRLRGK